MIERRQQLHRGVGRNAAGRELRRDPLASELVQLVHGHQGLVVQAGRHPVGLEHPAQQPAVIQADDEVLEAQLAKHVTDG